MLEVVGIIEFDVVAEEEMMLGGQPHVLPPAYVNGGGDPGPPGAHCRPTSHDPGLPSPALALPASPGCFFSAIRNC